MQAELNNLLQQVENLHNTIRQMEFDNSLLDAEVIAATENLDGHLQAYSAMLGEKRGKSMQRF